MIGDDSKKRKPHQMIIAGIRDSIKKISKSQGRIFGIGKYIFAVLLATLAIATHRDVLFLMIALLEIASVAMATNFLFRFHRYLAYVVNTLLLLLINSQNLVLFFGGSYTTLVMVTNLDSLASLGGKLPMMFLGVGLLILFSCLPVYRIPVKYVNSSTYLASFLLIQLIVTQLHGNTYSPLYGVYQLTEDAHEHQKQLRKIAKQPNKTTLFYKRGVQNARGKPTNLPEKPNIVLVFVEGLSQNIIEDSRQVMPYVKSLQKKSVNFSNYYNHTFATYRGLIGQLYSGYQLDNQDINTLVSLQDVLADQGYQTAFINSEPLNTQFTSYLDRLQFHRLINEPERAKGINRTLTDQESLNLLYETIEEQHKTDKPFFTAIYTYGTHMSFGSADKMLDAATKQPVLDRFYNFDYYFKRFMKKFENSPIADDTILIFTTDHATFDDADFKAAYPDYQRANSDVDKIPLFLYYKGIQAEKLDVKGRNSLSMVPTVLDYLDISVPNYFLGQSLFFHKENNNVYDTVFFDNTYLLSTDYGEITPLSEVNEQTVREFLEEYFAAKTQPPKVPTKETNTSSSSSSSLTPVVEAPQDPPTEPSSVEPVEGEESDAMEFGE